MEGFPKRSLICFHFLLLLVNLEGTHGCGSEDEYKPCKFTDDFRSTAVTCEYRKGNDFKGDLVPITKSPGPARDLKVSLLPSTNNLLISWNLPQDSSIFVLEGFLLQVNFQFMEEEYNLLRTFKIGGNFTALKDDDISQIAMNYTCIGAFNRTTYLIRLTSYPLSNKPSVKETVIYVPNFSFNVVPEAKVSGNWLARMWSIIGQEGGKFFLTVCFYGAPKEFFMERYFLFLHSMIGGEYRYTEEVRLEGLNVTEMDGKEICGTFRNLTDNTYAVELLPFGPDECRCQFIADDGEQECYDGCTKTIIDGIVLKTPEVPKTDTEKWKIILAAAISIVVFIIVTASLIVLLRFALKKMKKIFYKRHNEQKVLIMIIDMLDRSVSTNLIKHLENHCINSSLIDLTEEETQPIIAKLERGHTRLLIIHLRSVDQKCNDLDESDTSTDKALKHSMNKFVKSAPMVRDNWCIHCLQLKEGGDAKVFLLKVIDRMTSVSDIYPPSEQDLYVEQDLESLFNYNENTTDLQYTCDSYRVSLAQIDSGFRSESMT